MQCILLVTSTTTVLELSVNLDELINKA